MTTPTGRNTAMADVWPRYNPDRHETGLPDAAKCFACGEHARHGVWVCSRLAPCPCCLRTELAEVHTLITSDEAVRAFGQAWGQANSRLENRPGDRRRAGLHAVANLLLTSQTKPAECQVREPYWSVCGQTESGGFACENPEPGHTVHWVSKHTINHAKAGNGYPCSYIEPLYRPEGGVIHYWYSR